MILLEAFILLTLSFFSLRLSQIRFRRSVSLAHSITANRKKGFVATEWYCNCGDDQCADKNVTADQLKDRYYAFQDSQKQQLYNQLVYLFFFLCITSSSMFQLYHLYINTLTQ